MSYVTVVMPVGLALMTFYFLIEAVELVGRAQERCPMNLIVVADAVLLTLLLVIGVPVPFCFAGASLLLFAFGDIGNAELPDRRRIQQDLLDHHHRDPALYSCRRLMSQGGIAGRLIDVADAVLGRTRGGLGLVVIFTTAIFGAISGMASSAVAAIGSIMIPKMVDRGYDRAYAAALVSASSVLALLIPPSASMILFGWVTGTSITACFLAPVLPGFVLIALFAFWNNVLARRMAVATAEPATLRARSRIDVVSKIRRASLAC